MKLGEEKTSKRCTSLLAGTRPRLLMYGLTASCEFSVKRAKCCRRLKRKIKIKKQETHAKHKNATADEQSHQPTQHGQNEQNARFDTMVSMQS